MSQPAIDAGAVGAALDVVRSRISAAGGDLDRITLVAVTKGFGPDAVAAVRAAGVSDVGENYAQELVTKAETLTGSGGEAVRWHFLGPVQRNKVASLVPHVFLWQAVDRLVAGQAIAARCPGAPVLVQVSQGDPGRPGCPAAEVPDLVEALGRLHLEVRGLMAMGPLGPAEDARPLFRTVARLATRLGLQQVSMGVTDDLEVAVQEGATIVRVGRALFGPRPGRRAVPG